MATGPTSGTTDGTTGLVTTGEPGVPMYCPGVPEETSYPVCLVNEDCTEQFANCQPFPDGCGGPGCRSSCEQDSQCMLDDPNLVCVLVASGCCMGSGECQLSCLMAGCGEGETCLGSGHCGPTSCSDGHACPQGQACEPGAAGADPHGCLTIA